MIYELNWIEFSCWMTTALRSHSSLHGWSVVCVFFQFCDDAEQEEEDADGKVAATAAGDPTTSIEASSGV